MKTRKEFDSIGGIKVPAEKYWGASTERSNKFFNIGKILVNPSIIKSIAIIKRSAAIVHAKDKLIDKKISNTIVKAADEVIKGKLNDHFPLKVWQTGSGTVIRGLYLTLKRILKCRPGGTHGYDPVPKRKK